MGGKFAICDRRAIGGSGSLGRSKRGIGYGIMMADLGLVPSEHSTGDTVERGPVTTASNRRRTVWFDAIIDDVPDPGRVRNGA